MVRTALDLWTVPVSSIACPSKGIPFSHPPCQEAVSSFQRGSHNKVLQILINRSEYYIWISNELRLLNGLYTGHSNFFKRRKGSGDYRLLTQNAINTLSTILTRPSFLKDGLGTGLQALQLNNNWIVSNRTHISITMNEGSLADIACMIYLWLRYNAHKNSFLYFSVVSDGLLLAPKESRVRQSVTINASICIQSINPVLIQRGQLWPPTICHLSLFQLKTPDSWMTCSNFSLHVEWPFTSPPWQQQIYLASTLGTEYLMS